MTDITATFIRNDSIESAFAVSRSARPANLPVLLLTAAFVSCAFAASNSMPANSPPDCWIKPIEDPNIIGVLTDPAPPVGTLGEVASAPVDVVWHTDYAAALRRAAQEKKLVLLNFTGSDWCVWCKRLETDVFSKSEFIDYAAPRLVLVKVDFPRNKSLPAAEVRQNAQLQQQFGIKGYPTVIAVDASVRKVAEIRGYVRGGPKGFIAALERQTRR